MKIIVEANIPYIKGLLEEFGSVEYLPAPAITPVAVKDADALLLLTEWKQFRMPAWKLVRSLMRQPVVIDGRNIYDSAEMKDNGIEYLCIGG